MTDWKWFESLNVGDEVAIREDGRLSIHKIEKLTAKQIETKYHKFSRKTGYAFNNNQCATICPVTPELRESIEDAFERKKLRAVISLALPSASADTLRAMIKALQPVPDDSPEPVRECESGKRWRPGR